MCHLTWQWHCHDQCIPPLQSQHPSDLEAGKEGNVTSHRDCPRRMAIAMTLERTLMEMGLIPTILSQAQNINFLSIQDPAWIEVQKNS